MHYIKLAIYLTLFLLAGCSHTMLEDPGNTSSNFKQTEPQLTENVLEEYKTALYAMRNKQMPLAKPLLLGIIKKYPDLAGPHVNIAIIYYKQGDVDKAMKSLKTALAKNPTNAYAHNLLASIYQHNGNFSLAEKHFLLALNYKKDYAIAHYNIALLYDIFFHKIKKSIKYYKKYLSILKKQGQTDKQTSNWLEQLENSLKQG